MNVWVKHYGLLPDEGTFAVHVAFCQCPTAFLVDLTLRGVQHAGACDLCSQGVDPQTLGVHRSDQKKTQVSPWRRYRMTGSARKGAPNTLVKRVFPSTHARCRNMREMVSSISGLSLRIPIAAGAWQGICFDDAIFQSHRRRGMALCLYPTPVIAL